MRFRWFRGRVPGLDPNVERVYECRHCGTSVESAAEPCPACARSDIATYEFR